MLAPTQDNLRKLAGKQVYLLRKDGTCLSGKLIRTGKNQYVLRRKGKAAHTKAFIPLVLFDLLAVGTEPFTYPYPYPYPYPGYGSYGGYGGYPGYGPWGYY